MNKWIMVWLMWLPSLALASGHVMTLDAAHNDLADKASLQRGAALFINYCFGCHATQYQRYERVADDLGIPHELMTQNLIFDPTAKIGSLMTNSLDAKSGEKWFGVAPPDLTLVARVRGSDWLYTYLRAFYADPSRPFGVNNRLFPNVAMPHVLEALQGIPEPVYATIQVDGQAQQVVTGTQVVGQAALTPQQYDNTVRDLVNFLEYSGDPVQLERHALGWWVMAFLVIFTVLVVFLKKEYWRDVH